MSTCPECGTSLQDEQCPDCAARPARFGPEHDLKLVSVYTAQDEMTARLVKSLLESNGVLAYIHSEQASMFGSILQADHGCWGEVMVPAPYHERGMEVVQAFMTEDPDRDVALGEEATNAPLEEEEAMNVPPEHQRSREEPSRGAPD